MRFKILLFLACLLFSCNRASEQYNYKKGSRIAFPELPLLLVGDTIPEPVPNRLKFISMVDGTCWSCMGDYTALKEVFSQIQKESLDISYFTYIKALDYEEVATTLALFGFFYPIYIDRYSEIYTINRLDGNIKSLLVDKDNRLLWAGNIPHSSSEMKKFLRIIRKNSL